MSESVTDQTRELVWEGLIDAERDFRYANAVLRRYRRRHQIIRVFLGVSSAAAVTHAFGLLPLPFYMAGAAVIGAVAAFEVVMDFSRKTAVLALVEPEYDELHVAWHRLWIDTARHDAEDARIVSRHDALVAIRQQVNRRETTAGVDLIDKLNQETTEDAYETLNRRYNTHSRGKSRRIEKGGSAPTQISTATGGAEASTASAPA